VVGPAVEVEVVDDAGVDQPPVEVLGALVEAEVVAATDGEEERGRRRQDGVDLRLQPDEDRLAGRRSRISGWSSPSTDGRWRSSEAADDIARAAATRSGATRRRPRPRQA